MAEDLDAWESFVGAGKGQARICRCAAASRRLPPALLCAHRTFARFPVCVLQSPRRRVLPAC